MPRRVAIGIGIPVPLNAPYSYSGPFIVRNESDSTIVLDSAELVRPDPGISYLGAYALRPSKYRTTIGAAEGFKGGRVRGYRVASHAWVQVVFGVAVSKPGRHEFQAVGLRYHDGGGHRFHDQYPFSGRFCAPTARFIKTCPAP